MAEFHPTPSATLDGLLAHARAADDLDLLDDVRGALIAARRAEAEQAVRLVALQEVAETAHRDVQAATDEIGVLLGISSRSAEHLVGNSLLITGRPLVWDAWHLGLLDKTKAQKIVNLLIDVPDPLRERLEAQAVAYAETHTPAQLHRLLIRLTCDEDPDEKQRRDALASRGVSVYPAAHGMCDITIRTSLEHGEAFLQTLDQMATGQDCPDPYEQGENRTLDQRRADAFTGFLETHTSWSIDVHVSMPADMLMGVETKGANLNGSPITHALALRLAWSPDARWTRLVTDPLTGTLLDAGTTAYRIPDKLRNAVRLRDQRCRFPGCTRPAEYTDTDHVIPYRLTHATNAKALICLCRHHHRTKTFGNWHITTDNTYSTDTTWTGPLGTTRTTRPPNLHRGE